MEFIAVDVNEGDCFVLKNAGQTIVVDGGKDRIGVVSRLRKCSIGQITQLCCTHYDADHVNGIIGICESPLFRINEIVLPSIWADVIYTIQMHANNRSFWHEVFESSQEPPTVDGIPEYSSSSLNDNENAYELLDQNILESLSSLSPLLYTEWFPYSFQCYLPYITGNIIRKISRIVLSSVKSGAHIRWMKYQDHVTNRKISKLTNLYVLNAIEVAPVVLSAKNLAYCLFALTKINKESLVFRYKKEGNPEVLFSGDSNYSFTGGRVLNLENDSLVTAPHHGSQSNSSVYSLINGVGLVYVRSDRFQNVRPCPLYIGLLKKYCTTCKGSVSKTAIRLTFLKQWITNNSSCICT